MNRRRLIRRYGICTGILMVKWTSFGGGCRREQCLVQAKGGIIKEGRRTTIDVVEVGTKEGIFVEITEVTGLIVTQG